jgi:hypothetical protein
MELMILYLVPSIMIDILVKESIMFIWGLYN